MKKRAFLKVVASFMALTMFVLVGGGFTFSDVNGTLEKDTCCYETDIVLEGIDCEETEQLIIALLNGEEFVSPRSIFCIFGHSISTGTAIVTDHRFWAEAPRCRETRFRVEHCTRSSCNWMTMTQTTQSRIRCCA
jgi:hypothetical protein